MRLPHMKYGDDITKQTQLAFGGYNHTPNAKDGEIYDMQNTSSDLYPLLTQRQKREEVGQINAVVYRSKKYWMGNIGGKGEIFIYIPGIYLSERIKSYDILEISVKGTYAQNSGKHIVNWVSLSSDGYTTINLHEALLEVGDEEERPSKNNGEIPINANEITIKIVKRVSGSSSSETVESEYVSEEFNKSDVTTYTLEEDKLTIENNVVEKANAWNKKKTVTTREVSYSEEADYVQNEYYLDDSYISNQLIIIPKAKTLESNTDYEMSKFKITTTDGGVLKGYARSFERSDSTYTTLWIAGLSGSVTSVMNNTVTIEVYKRHLGEPIVIETEEILDIKDNDASVLVNTEHEWIQTSVIWTAIYKKTVTHRKIIKELTGCFLNILSIDASDKIFFVTDEGEFYYDGVLRGVLEIGEKWFAQTGYCIYILPDNVYYDIAGGKIVKNESVYVKAYNGQAAFNGNYIEADQDLRMFAAGDVVNIYVRSDKKKYTFTEVEIKSVSFYQYSKFCQTSVEFTENILEREGFSLDNFGGDVWGFYSFEITKGTPNLKYICADKNRIWGCDDKIIYCTSFGNSLGWYEYDASQVGNDADIAWAIEPFDSEGDFTGCCIYNDRPMFFKENKIYKVYGSKASDFQLSVEDTPGVSKGSAESICIIDSILYYLSPEGVMRYTGNYGTCISDKFYESFENAVGGSDGVHYYITMQSGEEWKTFTYNTKNRLWCVEDNGEAKRYFNYERYFFRHNSDGQIECINPSSAEYPEIFEKGEMENDFESFIEFGDFYVDVLNKKAPSKLYFRFLVEENANVEILINYDSEEIDGQRVWESVKKIVSGSKKSIIVPMIPKRCDHYRIKIKGKGKWTLYAMSYEYYVGTEL